MEQPEQVVRCSCKNIRVEAADLVSHMLILGGIEVSHPKRRTMTQPKTAYWWRLPSTRFHTRRIHTGTFFRNVFPSSGDCANTASSIPVHLMRARSSSLQVEEFIPFGKGMFILLARERSHHFILVIGHDGFALSLRLFPGRRSPCFTSQPSFYPVCLYTPRCRSLHPP